MFADRTSSGAPSSPVSDRPDGGKKLKARFVRLTITGADVPQTADGLDEQNATNAWSVFEMRVFKK